MYLLFYELLDLPEHLVGLCRGLCQLGVLLLPVLEIRAFRPLDHVVYVHAVVLCKDQNRPGGHFPVEAARRERPRDQRGVDVHAFVQNRVTRVVHGEHVRLCVGSRERIVLLVREPRP